MIFFLIYLAFGILANFGGPLAKHLRIENTHSLKENKKESWFYKYSFIFATRIFMTLIYPVFFFSYYILKKKPIVPISFEDEINISLVKRFRQIGEYNNTAPTQTISDEKIIEIYTKICTSFRKASLERQERIPANNLNTIAMKFFKVYEDFGENFMQDHLKYEVDKYLKEGLRSDYQRELPLF
jgi:hypothetical protein